MVRLALRCKNAAPYCIYNKNTCLNFKHYFRARNYQHLYESLTRNSSIYESQEIKVKMDDDISQLNDYIIAEVLIFRI